LKTRRSMLVVMSVLLICSVACATIFWQRTFDDLYKPKAGTPLAKARCLICHTNSSGGDGLNAYGKALNGKRATAASLKSIEKLDSDKDGATNIAEIKAGLLPGNPKSKPSSKPVSPPKKKK